MNSTQLDKLDLRILSMLAGAGRKPYLEIARECGVSGAAIHQRITKLNGSGVLTSVETHFDPHVVGFDVCVYATLTVSCPLNEAIAKLDEIPEVVDCHVIMGQDQLQIKIYARDNAHLDNIINKHIRPIGITRMQTNLSLREAFHKPMPLEFPK